MNMQIDKELLAQAKYLVFKTRNYSISHLQRNLSISYNHASNIMEIIINRNNPYTRFFSKNKKRFRYVS